MTTSISKAQMDELLSDRRRFTVKKWAERFHCSEDLIKHVLKCYPAKAEDHA